MRRKGVQWYSMGQSARLSMGDNAPDRLPRHLGDLAAVLEPRYRVTVELNSEQAAAAKGAEVQVCLVVTVVTV